MVSRPSPEDAREVVNFSRRPFSALIALESLMDCQLLLTASKRYREHMNVWLGLCRGLTSPQLLARTH